MLQLFLEGFQLSEPCLPINASLQDMLVTQSEYVRSELMQLKGQLEVLEERANNIEADIRNVMSEGQSHWTRVCSSSCQFHMQGEFECYKYMYCTSVSVLILRMLACVFSSRFHENLSVTTTCTVHLYLC